MRNPSSSHRDAPVTVSFPVPKKAASKLRTLAISKDRRLMDLGVLAVQINEGESIVLGIKLGRQRFKITEVDSNKLRGSSSAGRVAKRPSLSCRNAATIHHLPAASTQAHKLRLPAVKNAPFSLENVEENSRKGAVQPDGDATSDELFSVLCSRRTVDKGSRDSKFRVSDYTDASVLSGNTEEQSTSSGSLPKKSKARRPHSSGSPVTERSLVGTEQNMQTPTPFSVRTSEQTPPVVTPKASRLLSGQNDSSLLAARRLSSPSSQRAYSTSPCSETSSSSSEELLDVQQLIYNCFVDTSKYSAADMLKKLAEAHERKKETANATTAMNISTLPRAVKTSTTTGKSVPRSKSVLELPKILATSQANSKRPVVPGSYREHVKNIRCNSLTSLTTSTSTVNSTLKAHTNTTEALTRCVQSCSSNVEKSSGFGDMKPMMHVSQSKPSTDSQSNNITTGSNQPSSYHRGRKVLWSSTNILPNRSKLTPTLSSVSFPQVSSTSQESVTSLSQVQGTVTSPSIMKNDTATCDKRGKSTYSDIHISVLKSNKQCGKELAEECQMMPSDSKTVIMKTPSLSFDSPEAVTASDTGSSQSTVSTSSPCLPGVTCSIQSESQASKQFVQNLTLARSTLAPATVVLAGTNTQTTWSNQQVSPTYFVGAQGQYGIYPTMYSATDANNNQLGQQAVTATYPLNYVYPISFVYPYLSMAQASNLKSANEDKGQQKKEEEEVKSDVSGGDETCTVSEGKTEPGTISQTASGNMVNVESNNTIATPVQTQFIDLASSMRYWQQLSLLCRARWQPVASCNLPNVAAVTSNPQVNVATTASSTANHSSSTVTNGETSAVNSHSVEQPFSKLEILQSNPSEDSSARKGKSANDLCAEKPCSELLQSIKPEISLEPYSKDPSSDRPSVIVTAACNDGMADNELPKSSALDMKMEFKQRELNDQALQKLKERRAVLSSVSYETSQTSEDEIHSPRLDCNQLKNMATASLRKGSFCGSAPKLSFIHDSSIARVNIGSSNGNGLHYSNHEENHIGVRRTCKFWQYSEE